MDLPIFNCLLGILGIYILVSYRKSAAWNTLGILLTSHLVLFIAQVTIIQANMISFHADEMDMWKNVVIAQAFVTELAVFVSSLAFLTGSWIFLSHVKPLPLVSQQATYFLLHITIFFFLVVIVNGLMLLGRYIIDIKFDMSFLRLVIIPILNLLFAVVCIFNVATIIALWGMFEETRRTATYCKHTLLMTIPGFGVGWFFMMLSQWKKCMKNSSYLNKDALVSFVNWIVWLSIAYIVVFCSAIAALKLLPENFLVQLLVGASVCTSLIILLYFWTRLFRAIYVSQPSLSKGTL